MKLAGNIDLVGGQLVNSRLENLTSLPVFVPGQDEGRILLVTMGLDTGYWVGAIDGTAAFRRIFNNGHVSNYTLTAESINDGIADDVTLVEDDGGGSSSGFLAKVTLASSLSSGTVRVQLYEDTARTSKFYDAYFDLANLSDDRFPAYFAVDNVDGDIYATITNLTGSNGTFDLVLLAASIFPVQTLPPPGNGSGINSAVAGEGIIYDGINGRIDVDLLTNGGLQLTGSPGVKKLSVKFKVAGGVTDTGTGTQLDSAVAVVHGVDQANITNQKIFAQFGIKPAGSPGAPGSGTHVAGELYTDSNKDVWQCVVSGTPGTWVLFSNKLTSKVAGPAAVTYVGNILALGSLQADIILTGRRGTLKRFNVWAADPAFAASNISVPFRVAAYLDEGCEERDRVWSISGTFKKTYLTANANAGTASLQVSDLTAAAPGDLLRIRKASTPIEEYGRISTEAGTWTLFENLVNSSVSNDNIMLVNEFRDLAWLNTSANPTNFHKLYLKFFNDHASQTILVGYEMLVVEQGGGLDL